jgi:hypothetical protein
MTFREIVDMLAATLVAVGVLAGCGSSPTTVQPTTTAAGAASKTPAPENNPVGDIPDTQVYVPFSPPAQVFSVSVPEGWAQSTDGAATVFTDKLNAVRVEEQPELIAVTPETVQRQELPAVQAATPGYRFGGLSVVQRASGPVILATYQATSPPNDVTAKVGVDSVERYVFWRDGHEVILTLSGPLGADNVDPWRTITDSLQWK